MLKFKLLKNRKYDNWTGFIFRKKTVKISFKKYYLKIEWGAL